MTMADLFASKKNPKKEKADPNTVGIPTRMNELNARLKMNEERFSELRKKMQFIEQSFLKHQKKLIRELKVINSDIEEDKKGITELKSKINLIIKELQLSASREDVEVLKKYLELWQPVKFVTENQVERIVGDKVYELMHANKSEDK